MSPLPLPSPFLLLLATSLYLSSLHSPRHHPSSSYIFSPYSLLLFPLHIPFLPVSCSISLSSLYFTVIINLSFLLTSFGFLGLSLFSFHSLHLLLPSRPASFLPIPCNSFSLSPYLPMPYKPHLLVYLARCCGLCT